jgi:transposase
MKWIIRAEQSGIKMLEQFAKTIRKHFKSILAHYQYPLSTGILEGTNNKLKLSVNKRTDFVTRNISNSKSKQFIGQSMYWPDEP